VNAPLKSEIKAFMVTVAREEHEANAPPPIDVTVAGIVTDVIPVLLKDSKSILVRVEGRVTVAKAEHPLKH
jgi:hypothetical protein